MTGRQSDSTRRLAVWLALASGCFALAGCGHSARSFLARLRGGSSAVAHSGPAAARPARAPAVALDIELAGSESPEGLTFDPFIGHSTSATLSGGIESPRARDPFDRLVATEDAAHRNSAEASPPTGPAGLSYLDSQLDRLDSDMRQWGHTPQRPAAGGFEPSARPLAADSAAPSIASNPRTVFDALARRESARPLYRSAHSGQSTAFTPPPRGSRVVAPVLEELAPSPDARDSHLSMIVDSDLIPRRVGGRMDRVLGNAPPASAAEPDFLAVDIQMRPEAGPGFRSAMLSGSGVQRVTANHGGLIATADPPPPEFISSGPSDRGPPEVLPELDLDLDALPPAPAAPDVGEPWPRIPDRSFLGVHSAGDQSPRTLETIQFVREGEAGRGPGLVRLRGPLVVGLGLLLVACAAAAMRRHATGT